MIRQQLNNTFCPIFEKIDRCWKAFVLIALPPASLSISLDQQIRKKREGKTRLDEAIHKIRTRPTDNELDQ
jgi:hypothetical protein